MLRDYQKQMESAAREELRTNRSTIIQGATGSGKSIVFANILTLSARKNYRSWIIVPRNALADQASGHLFKWGTPHGIIKASSKESRAYKTHVVSKDTIIRRLNAIKNPPDLILIDECHIAIEQQKRIAAAVPNAKIIGFTATPEIQDGRGLSTAAGGIYDSLVLGPSIPDLTERGFLTPLRYFAPPLEGLEELDRSGTDVNADQFEKLLERKKVYGEAIHHYREKGNGKPALGFCRDVKSAYRMAEEFTNAGFKFHCIEGKMAMSKRRALIQALTDGEIDGLTNCEIATYGLDIPRVEVGIIMRPTESRSLYMQMNGRLIRPFEIRVCHKCGKKYYGLMCPKCKIIGELIYEKESAVSLDHVNNLLEHSVSVTADGNPIPLHYENHIDWNFDGKKRRKKILCGICKNYDRCELVKKEKAKKCDTFRPEKKESVRYCQECGKYFTGDICKCGAKYEKKQRKEPEVVDLDLKEVTYIKLNDREPEERREYVDRININNSNFKEKMKTGQIDSAAVADMIKISEDLGNNVLWIYWKLTSDDRISVNVPLLQEIGRLKDYKKGWAGYQIQKIRNQIEVKKNEIEQYAKEVGVL